MHAISGLEFPDALDHALLGRKMYERTIVDVYGSDFFHGVC